MPAVQSRDPLTLVPGGAAMPWPPRGNRFSTQAQRALARAQDEAVRLLHNHVGPVHLLAGIGCADAGVGTEVLRDLGASAERVREALTSVMARGEEPFAPEDITLIPHAQRVLDLAVARSRKRGQSSATSEDLLFALVEEHEHFTTQLLGALGLEPSAIRQRLLDANKHSE